MHLPGHGVSYNDAIKLKEIEKQARIIEAQQLYEKGFDYRSLTKKSLWPLRIYVLDEGEQHEELWEHGVLIAHRKDDVHRFIFYQLHSYYVELSLHREFNYCVACVAFAVPIL